MPFRKKVRIYFDQGDPAQIAFYGQHSIIVQRVMEDYIRSLGIPWESWYKSERLFMPVVRLRNEYKKPLFPGEEYIAELQVTHVGKSSVGFFYKILTLKEELCCVVEAVYVCSDRRRMKSRPLPPEWVIILKKALKKAPAPPPPAAESSNKDTRDRGNRPSRRRGLSPEAGAQKA